MTSINETTRVFEGGSCTIWHTSFRNKQRHKRGETYVFGCAEFYYRPQIILTLWFIRSHLDVNSAKQPLLVAIFMLLVGESLLGECKWMKSALSYPGRSQNDEIGHTGTKRKKTACMTGCIYLYVADCHKRSYLHYCISCLMIFHRWCSQDQILQRQTVPNDNPFSVCQSIPGHGRHTFVTARYTRVVAIQIVHREEE